MNAINLFYEEPEPDRWFKYDHFLRKLARRIIRGKPQPGGVKMIAVNLMKGLDKIGAPYRFNDYHYIRKHTDEIACILGKPQLLFDKEWHNPIIFGAGIYSHPIECPDLFTRYPTVRRFLVPGEWMQKMCEPYYGSKVLAWPAGIDTDYWHPASDKKKIDFLIYDKIRWQRQQQHAELIDPIFKTLNRQKASYHIINYGNYTHKELIDKLNVSRAVIFLCEHETQGAAYQQILATDTPIMAWDRGGYWQDPYYYPDKIKYQPVSSVPYWDGRCGVKFRDANDFTAKLPVFLNQLSKFKPRDYILNNLTLERCAEKYLEIHNQVEREISTGVN